MKENIKKWLKPILFTAGGALVALHITTLWDAPQELVR